METVVAPVSPEDSAAFQALLAIYQEAIEKSEQKPPDAVAALLRDERYMFLVSRTGREITGFAIIFFPPDSDFWLLEYMAVAATARSTGIGGKLFQDTLVFGRTRSGGNPCLLEVDQPNAPVSPSNDPRRRLQFYAANGCRRLVGLNYILPLDVAGTPPPMQLLVHGLDGSSDVPVAVVRVWLSTLYSQVYGCAPDDPRIDVMLDRMKAHIRLAPL